MKQNMCITVSIYPSLQPKFLECKILTFIIAMIESDSDNSLN